MVDERDPLDVPTSGATDTALSVVKAAISAVPVFGGPAVELMNLVIMPPLERRRVEWMNQVADRLRDLQDNDRDFDLESLQNNHQFISIILTATSIAMKTHREEKLSALQSAVVNTALKIDVEEHLQYMFLQYVDQLTPLHVKIVWYFHDPAGWLDRRSLTFPYQMAGADKGLEIGIPELVDQRAIYSPMVDDLHYKGLITGDRQLLGTLMSKSGVLGKRTTLIGDKFLRYIGLIDQ